MGLLALALLLAGCVGSPPDESGAPSPGDTSIAPAAPDPCKPDAAACREPETPSPSGEYTLRLSNCTEVAHTLYVPSAVFEPDYPPGTRAANAAATIFYVDALMCEQATDHNSTLAPFHVAVFGASIDPPDQTAQDATQSFAGYDVITNHANLAATMREAGWTASVSGEFGLAWTGPAPGDQEAAPYSLAIPTDKPVVTFHGSRSSSNEGSQFKDQEHYYTHTDAQQSYVKIAMEGSWVGNGQPATTVFDANTSWTKQGGPPSWEAVNFVRLQAGGTISIHSVVDQ